MGAARHGPAQELWGWTKGCGTAPCDARRVRAALGVRGRRTRACVRPYNWISNPDSLDPKRVGMQI